MAFSYEKKQEIASHIKNISLEDAEQDFRQLCQTENPGFRCQIGNNVVDYFTFVQRLETKGKYNASYFDFLANLDYFQKKKFIRTMFDYYEVEKNKNGTKHFYKVVKEVYNICISAINIMRPLNCMEIFRKYGAKRVLNFCSGWGGSMVAAAALNLDAHYAVDSNLELLEPYKKMIKFLNNQQTSSAFLKTDFFYKIADAATVDYSKMDYDTVFVSPPYYFLEIYEHMPSFDSKQDMDDNFYRPVFAKTFLHLKCGGHFIVNVCKDVFERVLLPLLGQPFEQFPLKKAKRQNNYTEYVYTWRK